MTAYQSQPTRSTFGKDREKAVRGIARNLTIDEWATIKSQYRNGFSRVQAPRGYVLSRHEVEMLAQVFGDQLAAA